jgi:hypothetical protein
MDGVLLEVHNQKERCYDWIHVAATSHIQIWSLLISQGPTDIIITLSILVVRHSLVSVYPTPTKYVSASDHHQGMSLGFCEDPSPVPARPGCWHWFLCTLHLLLADCVHGFAYHALKLISALKFPPSEGVPLSTLWVGYHIYSRGLSIKG